MSILSRVSALLAFPALALACGGHGVADSMIVSTSWLAAHLKDPHLVILAVGDRADYNAGHIPGSVFVEYKEVAPKGENGLSAELPPMPTLAALFANLGVSNGSWVIVYRLKDTLTAAARVTVTLDAMGLGPNTSMLDGNMATWTGEGRAASKDAPVVKPGKLVPCPQTDVITNLDFVKTNLHQPGVKILDARAPEFYTGASSRPGLVAGHIEGAGNVYFNNLFDDAGKLKPAAQLQEQFRAAGVKQGDRVVTYCFVGQQASALYFVSRYLGYDTRLYDGSWEEWSKHPELPTAK